MERVLSHIYEVNDIVCMKKPVCDTIALQFVMHLGGTLCTPDYE